MSGQNTNFFENGSSLFKHVITPHHKTRIIFPENNNIYVYRESCSRVVINPGICHVKYLSNEINKPDEINQSKNEMLAGVT